MWSPGPVELVVIGMAFLLLFGKRLPDVMRSVGKGIVEFKKGVSGIEDEIDKAASAPRELPTTSKTEEQKEKKEEVSHDYDG